MIEFHHVWLRYREQSAPVLRDVDFTIEDGQLVLVSGRTGSGKTTLLGAVNGHVPHFTGGMMSGSVVVDGLDTASHPPRELSGVVGMVAQDPLAGFVTDTVEEELAYSMEQMGVAAPVMRTRVEETLDILGLAELRGRTLRTLSGGQQQRVAIGSVLAAGVRVLVLDEPTSALDPVSSEEVLAALLRLVHDLGLTVVVAEHRLERVVGYADAMLALRGDGTVRLASPREIMATSSLIPPVVELGRAVGMPGVPLTVREARGWAGPLRTRLEKADPASYDRLPRSEGCDPASQSTARVAGVGQGLDVASIRLNYGSVMALDGVDLRCEPGMVTVVMGRNGSGKSSLLWALTGVVPIQGGRFSVDGRLWSTAKPREIRRVIRLVPQSAADLLYLDSVQAECDAADHQAGVPSGSCQGLLDRLAPGIDPVIHPRDLSEGQKLCLVLAIQLTGDPAVILLDEPTRGLDYPAKTSLARILTDVARQGRVVLMVTHDVEFAAVVADQILVMAQGQVIQAGTAEQVLGTSALFASQVAKVLYPQRWLTPYQVVEALEGQVVAGRPSGWGQS
ncbi:MAG: ATP-binding cassette domain-containing protein [Propionibacteriaceae bacterium]|jgi:energy-coupling factor transport system ATP-binding protein|nr:ATP-binding cassette domain-containing protein [Propionibacteriaceae bacterium]